MSKSKGKIMAEEQKYAGICVSNPAQAIGKTKKARKAKSPFVFAGILILVVFGAIGLGAVCIASQQPDPIADKAELAQETADGTDALNKTDTDYTNAIPRGNCIGLEGLSKLSDERTSMMLTALGETLGADSKVVFSDIISEAGDSSVVYVHKENDAQWYIVQINDYRASVSKLTAHVKGVNDAQWESDQASSGNVGDTSDGVGEDVPRNRYDTSKNIALSNTDELIGLDIPEKAAKALPTAFDEWAKKKLLSVESTYAGVYPIDVETSSDKVKFEIDADDGQTTVVIDCTYDVAKDSLSFKRVKK